MLALSTGEQVGTILMVAILIGIFIAYALRI